MRRRNERVPLPINVRSVTVDPAVDDAGVALAPRCGRESMSRPAMKHPYADFVHLVEKPARYLGGEYNAVVKDWSTVECTFCLAFPDIYDIGMSHLGTKILYSVVNKDPRFLMERAFAPWNDMETEIRARDLPLLSLESARALRDFDVLGFSLQFEMTFTNILNMLDLGRVPLRNAARTLDDPLVIAGGPTATHPEPMAPFIDVFLIGDAEERLPRLLEHWAQLKREGGRTRLEMIAELAKEGGLYCPDLYTRVLDERGGFMVVDRPIFEGVPERVERAFLDDISKFKFPDDSPVAVAEAIFDRMSVEIARGCTEGCRFCQAGMIYRPVRERDPQEIVDTIVSAVEKGGYDEASLTALSTADFSCISPLVKKVMDELRPRKVSLGISSLRAYGLDEDLLDEIQSVKATGLTFAPEAGSQRMRDVINKNISEEDILTTCHRVFSRGWTKMKFYFIIGLPTETDEDVKGIALLGKKALNIGRTYRRNTTVTVSVSSHVPKPHTPFQWAAMDSVDDINRKQQILFELSREYGFRFRRHDMFVSWLEGIITRGDIRTGFLLERAWQLGAKFDSWDEQLALEAWKTAIAEFEAKYDLEHTLFLGTIPTDARLPWDHIDVGLEDKFLVREWKKATAGRLSPPCGKPVGAQVHHTNVADAVADERLLVCYHCGIACDMTQMREERIDALTSLDALEKAERKEERSDFYNAQQRVKKGLTPHDFQQGEAFRYRLRYTKLGAMALQGHLDLVRDVPRLLRRAKIEAYFSEGFNPRPVMTFGPALSLGAESLGEYVDITLADDLSVRELLDRLNAVAPIGHSFIAARRLLNQQRGLNKVLDSLDFVLMLEPESLGVESVDAARATLQEALDRAAQTPVFPITIQRKKSEKTLDLHRVARTLELLETLPEGVEVSEGRVGLRMVLRFADGPSLKPMEVLEALLGRELDRAHIIRLNCSASNRPMILSGGKPEVECVSPDEVAATSGVEPMLDVALEASARAALLAAMAGNDVEGTHEEPMPRADDVADEPLSDELVDLMRIDLQEGQEVVELGVFEVMAQQRRAQWSRMDDAREPSAVSAFG